MQKMMIAQEPVEPCIVPHHASRIKEKDNEQPVHEGVGKPEGRDHGAYALKRALYPMPMIGIPHSWLRVFMMDPVIEIEISAMQNTMGDIEPNIIAQNCYCDV